MKVLIPILIGLLVVGCGKDKQSTNTNEGNNTPAKSSKKEVGKTTPSKGDDNNSTSEKPTKELTKEDVVGTYEGKNKDGDIGKIVFHENGKVELFENGDKKIEGTWKMVGKEAHLDFKIVISVFKIEPNGDLDLIARIRNSKREEVSKDPQRTLKKIKVEPKETSSNGDDNNNQSAAKKPETATDPQSTLPTPNPTAEKPLTEEESAKVIEAAIRKQLKKPSGELTKADLKKLTFLILSNKQLTDWKGLEKLTLLKELYLKDNPNLTKAQIDELQKALPKCRIEHNAEK